MAGILASPDPAQVTGSTGGRSVSRHPTAPEQKGEKAKEKLCRAAAGLSRVVSWETGAADFCGPGVPGPVVRLVSSHPTEVELISELRRDSMSLDEQSVLTSG
jgi:hypothetical protein